MPLEPILPPNLPTPPSGLAQRLARLADGARAGEQGAGTDLRQACGLLEAHFVGWLLREMRQTVPHDGLLPYGPTEETYDQLFDDALAKNIAHGGGLGLARVIEQQLLRRQPAPAAGPADPAARPPDLPSAESR